MTRVNDFLPSPEQLVMPNDTIKITIALSKSSISFFKQRAKRHHTKYQQMIRKVVDRYAAQYSQI